MTDETLPASAAADVSSVPAAQPVAPAASVAAPASSTPESVAQPAPAAAPVSDVAPASAVPEATPVAAPTLLSPDPIKPADPAAKPAEGAPAHVADPAAKDGSPSAEPAPLPTYEPFVLPEGFKAQEERLGDFGKMLGEFENGPKTREDFQKFGQSLVDTHVSGMRELENRIHQSYATNWETLRTDRIKKFESDPEIGGNRAETSLTEAKKFINTHGGKPEHVAAFYKALQDTGAANHPDVVRFFVNANNSESFRAPQPVPAQTPALKESKTSKWYGGKK